MLSCHEGLDFNYSRVRLSYKKGGTVWQLKPTRLCANLRGFGDAEHDSQRTPRNLKFRHRTLEADHA